MGNERQWCRQLLGHSTVSKHWRWRQSRLWPTAKKKQRRPTGRPTGVDGRRTDEIRTRRMHLPAKRFFYEEDLAIGWCIIWHRLFEMRRRQHIIWPCHAILLLESAKSFRSDTSVPRCRHRRHYCITFHPLSLSIFLYIHVTSKCESVSCMMCGLDEHKPRWCGRAKQQSYHLFHVTISHGGDLEKEQKFSMITIVQSCTLLTAGNCAS